MSDSCATMEGRRHAICVVAKAPVSGRCKTRLSTEFSPSERVKFATCLLQDTIAAVTLAARRQEETQQLFLYFTPETARENMRLLLSESCPPMDKVKPTSNSDEWVLVSVEELVCGKAGSISTDSSTLPPTKELSSILDNFLTLLQPFDSKNSTSNARKASKDEFVGSSVYSSVSFFGSDSPFLPFPQLLSLGQRAAVTTTTVATAESTESTDSTYPLVTVTDTRRCAMLVPAEDGGYVQLTMPLPVRRLLEEEKAEGERSGKGRAETERQTEREERAKAKAISNKSPNFLSFPIFSGVIWSTADTFASQAKALAAAGLDVRSPYSYRYRYRCSNQHEQHQPQRQQLPSKSVLDSQALAFRLGPASASSVTATATATTAEAAAAATWVVDGAPPSGSLAAPASSSSSSPSSDSIPQSCATATPTGAQESRDDNDSFCELLAFRDVDEPADLDALRRAFKRLQTKEEEKEEEKDKGKGKSEGWDPLRMNALESALQLCKRTRSFLQLH